MRVQLVLTALFFIVLNNVSAQNNSLFLPGAINYVGVGDLDVPGDQLTVEALIQYT